MNHIFKPDTLIVLCYLTIIMSLGLYAARSISDNSKKYFFANHNLNWFIVALSLFATSITGNQVLGIIGMSSMDNLIPGQFGAIAALSFLILGWVFVPDFVREKVLTMPEYLEKKYGKYSRILYAIFSIVFYLFIRLSITLIAAGYILSKLLSIDAFTTSQIIVIITGIYVIIGGFSAVVLTQAVQGFFIMLIMFVLTWIGIYKVGDLGLVWNELTNTSTTAIRPLFFSGGLDILSFIGGLIIGIWFWCTDQFIVQRIISVRNKEHARQATMFTGFLHILLILLLVIITAIAGIIYSDKVFYLAFTQIILKMTMQSGIKGLVLTGALAIFMASLASLFNSIATVIAYDFTRKSNPYTSERKLVLKGRLITLAIVIFSILWIPIIRIAPDALLSFFIKLPVFCSPAIAALFLYARLHKNSGYNGAFSVILIGAITGILYTFLIIFEGTYSFNSELMDSILKAPYVYFTILLFGGSYLVLSFLNRKQNQLLSKKPRVDFNFNQLKHIILLGQLRNSGITLNATLSVILAIIVISMWWVFKI